MNCSEERPEEPPRVQYVGLLRFYPTWWRGTHRWGLLVTETELAPDGVRLMVVTTSVLMAGPGTRRFQAAAEHWLGEAVPPMPDDAWHDLVSALLAAQGEAQERAERGR